MKKLMNPLMMALVSMVCLSACGGAPEEAADEAPLPDPSTAVLTRDPVAGEVRASWTANCAGWENGARTCSWRCRSTSEWMWATQSVAYGQCNAYANNFCGLNAHAACWSSNSHP